MKNGLTCPRCENHDHKVTDSRPNGDGIRRRRECFGCGHRFSTIELRMASRQPMVVIPYMAQGGYRFRTAVLGEFLRGLEASIKSGVGHAIDRALKYSEEDLT